MQRVDGPSSNLVELQLPLEIILREIVSNLDPKFACVVLPQITKQLSSIIDSFFWKNKIEKHFPDYSLKCDLYLMSKQDDGKESDINHLYLYKNNGKIYYFIKQNEQLPNLVTQDLLEVEALKELDDTAFINLSQNALIKFDNEKIIEDVLKITSKRGHTLLKDPYNKTSFKIIETKKYPNFSEVEKELVRLIKERDIESIEKLSITHEMFDKKDLSGTSILSIAEKIDYPPLLSCLYKIGFDSAKISFIKEDGELDHITRDAQGRTILYWALIFGQSVEILLKLMKEGSFAELYFNQFQPFHLAVKLGRLDFLKGLFEDDAFSNSLGSLLEQKDVYGQTPLILAAKNNNSAIVSFLLDYQADHTAATGIFDQHIHQRAILGLIDYGDYGKTALHWLVQSGNSMMVKVFIEKFPPLLEEKDIFGETPLIWATRAGQAQVVKFFLDKGAKPGISTDRPYHSFHGKTAFHWAIQTGNLEMVKLFIEKFPDLMIQKDIFGEFPLIGAAFTGHAPIVKYFLDQRANPNVRTERPGHENDTKSPLYWAIAKGRKEVVELLIKSGAIDDHEYGEEKLRVMHLAAKLNKLEIVKLLTKTIPDLFYINEGPLHLAKNYIKNLPHLHDQKNSFDQTPLFFAAKEGHDEIVKFFLESNANINVKSNRPGHKDHMKTALHLAYEGKHVSTVALLMQNGVDATVPIAGTLGCVHVAAKLGEFEMLKALIENVSGTDLSKLLEQKDMFGQTALLLAADKGHTSIVTYLLSKGADPHVVSYSEDPSYSKDNGKTPLHWAYFGNHFDVAVLLFRAMHGKIVAINGIMPLPIPDQLKISLMQYAAENNSLELIKEVLESTEDKKSILDPIARNDLKNPLLIAIRENHLEIVEHVLSQGANPNISPDEDRLPFQGETPLYWAFQCGNIKLVAMLVKHGAITTLPGEKSGKSPIEMAVESGDLKMLKILIENDPRPFSLLNANGESALILAAIKGRLDIVTYLLSKKDDLQGLSDNHINEIKVKALRLALNEKDIDTVAILIESLVKSGIRVSTLGPILFKVMRFAVTHGNMRIINACLESEKSEEKKNELLNKKDERGDTLLSIAIKSEQFEMREYLLSQGASFTPQEFIQAVFLKTNGPNKLGDKKLAQYTVHNNQRSVDYALRLLQISRLVSFKLKNTNINFMEKFISAITPYSDRVIELEFDACHLNTNLINYIVQVFLDHRSSLTSFIVSDVTGDPGMFWPLALMLKQNTSLRELYLSNCHLDGQDASNFADMLIVNRTLSTLYLARNNIGDEGAYYLSYALESGAVISSLGLSKNNISHQGCQSLAKSLYHNMTLQKLLVFGNEFSMDTQELIDQSVARNIKLHMHIPSNDHNDAKLKEDHDKQHKGRISFGNVAKNILFWHRQNQMPAFIKCVENLSMHYENKGHIYKEDLNKIMSFSNLHYLIANFEIDKNNYEIFHLLFIRMVENGNIKIMNAFLKNKSIDLSYIQYSGTGTDKITVLSQAAYFGHAQLVKVFIAKGVDCNTIDAGYTPFMWAVRNGHVDVVKTFLHEMKFDELIKDKNDNKKLKRALFEYLSFNVDKNQINKKKYDQILNMLTHSRTSSVNDNVSPRIRKL